MAAPVRRWSHVGFQDSRRRRHPGSMINYDLKDNAVTHFPAIFKGLGSKPSVIHMALDVELHGGVLIVRVAGGRPMDCGKCSRGTVLELAAELRCMSNVQTLDCNKPCK